MNKRSRRSFLIGSTSGFLWRRTHDRPRPAGADSIRVSRTAPRSEMGNELQDGAQRTGQPQDDHLQLCHPVAPGDQSSGSGPPLEGRLGLAGDAHHDDWPSRRLQMHGVLQTEVSRDSSKTAVAQPTPYRTTSEALVLSGQRPRGRRGGRRCEADRPGHLRWHGHALLATRTGHGRRNGPLARTPSVSRRPHHNPTSNPCRRAYRRHSPGEQRNPGGQCHDSCSRSSVCWLSSSAPSASTTYLPIR
jgi:hypothetical protein